MDDSRNDVELALAALEESRCANEIIVVRDGVEALDYLFRRGTFANAPEETPAVIFLDLKMPRVDGLEVLRAVKGDPRLKNVPVVMLTSSREETDLLKSYELGVNAYVVKPVDFPQFIESVKMLGLFWGIMNEQPQPAVSR